MVRQEYPNPQFRREDYECLNGRWEFETGKGEGRTNCALSSSIEVPFAPESALSGVQVSGILTDCVYSRVIELTKKDLESRLVVHFGAVDHLATVYLNGIPVCRHAGGYTPFFAELNAAARVGGNRLTVVVHDDVRDNLPSGKQSAKEHSYGCFYTRTTGIWQTVWLERTPRTFLRGVRFFPDVGRTSVGCEVTAEGEGELTVRVLYEGRQVGCATAPLSFRGRVEIPLAEAHLWEPGAGRLYDVELSFGQDRVYSYFGLREVRYEGRKFLINGKCVFQRLVLDQGYYPDGGYTAPSVEAMRRDIALSKALGFNGARLHQKLFEPRFLYECDRAGYMVWGEYASWGVRYDTLDALGQFIAEWREAMERDFNHPCIVQWCPLNEVWTDLEDSRRVRDIRFVEAVYALTKALDDTRPCVDASGGFHGRHTDLYDFHCYHSPEEILGYVQAIESHDELTMDTVYPAVPERDTVYDGQLPLNASEYGGVAYVAESGGWGYRTSHSEREFVEDYISMTKLLLACSKLSGFCYTQLYDVEQEQNGLYTYDRRPKLSEEGMRAIAACNRAPAAIEQGASSPEEDAAAFAAVTGAVAERMAKLRAEEKQKSFSVSAE